MTTLKIFSGDRMSESDRLRRNDGEINKLGKITFPTSSAKSINSGGLEHYYEFMRMCTVHRINICKLHKLQAFWWKESAAFCPECGAVDPVQHHTVKT